MPQKYQSVLLAIVNVARRWNVALLKLSLNKTVIFVVYSPANSSLSCLATCDNCISNSRYFLRRSRVEHSTCGSYSSGVKLPHFLLSCCLAFTVRKGIRSSRMRSVPVTSIPILRNVSWEMLTAFQDWISSGLTCSNCHQFSLLILTP